MSRLLLLSFLAIALSSSSCSPKTETAEGHEVVRGETATAEEEDHQDSEESIVVLTAETEAAASLETALAQMRSLGNQLETTGLVGFDEDQLAHVGPRISGRVEKVLASLGDEVKAQQALAQIDSIELGRSKSEYLQARARHQLSSETLRREETLYADRISSEQEVLSARSALLEQEAAFASAEETLHLYGLGQDEVDRLNYDDPKASLFTLRAPFGGTVVERHVTRGELVAPGTNLFTIADLSRVWVWIDIYEGDLANVHLDDDVEVRVDAFPAETFNGKLSFVAHQVDPETRAVRARLDVSNSGSRLKSGMFARIRLTDPHSGGGGPISLSVVVPETAVQRDGDEFIVFVALGNHQFVRREVEIGSRAPGWTEILAGIEAGDEVVVQGAFMLKSEAAKGEMGEGHSH